MFRSLLIANRGEIACRVAETAKLLGIRTIAVYSDADRTAKHVAACDEAVRIGPAPARESYLKIEAILAAAKASGAEAIHPGYGFLSENADFAEACAKAGIVFVGPPADAIRAMGLKDAAKAIAEKAGVPIVPGYHGHLQDAEFLAGEAARIGFPVLIKAVAGGGGKGMRRVDKAGDFAAALAGAQREAEAAFGNPAVLVEKYVAAPRHIEIQIFGDTHGNVVHLFERDCSLQRRHQKVIEEAPAPGMSEGLRAAMGEAAVTVAKAVGYVGAGTVEFIVDGSEGLEDAAFYFMEMNTRLQVEHRVTEEITYTDLVAWQLCVAAGERLPMAHGVFDRRPIAAPAQSMMSPSGHAIEVRLCAEDTENGFLPSTGRFDRLLIPSTGRLREDFGALEGHTITPYYDPLFGKVIAHGDTREVALQQLRTWLSRFEAIGVKTNAAFLLRCLEHPAFIAGKFDTHFIERHLDALIAPDDAAARTAEALAVLAVLIDRRKESGGDPWDLRDGFRIGGVPGAEDVAFVGLGAQARPIENGFAVTLRSGSSLAAPHPEVPGPRLSRAAAQPPQDEGRASKDAGEERRVAILGGRLAGGTITAEIDGRKVTGGAIVGPEDVRVAVGPRSFRFALAASHVLDEAGVGGGRAITAPMPGRVVQILVKPGDAVTRGQPLGVLEAMKMEHTLRAPGDAVVASVAAQAGDQVGEGAVLIAFEEE
ncbi:MAG: biotin/lipoyl-binding protein [Alphaproteobacteria bacterium]|nr:biotin/lipoyl-binding protein [Alphaproteobacteria bacterium]